MQEEIEIQRIAKNSDTNVVAITKKMINLCDIVTVEEASQDLVDFLGRKDIVSITLTYDDLCILGSYSKYKKLFLEYGAYIRSKEGNRINYLKN